MARCELRVTRFVDPHQTSLIELAQRLRRQGRQRMLEPGERLFTEGSNDRGIAVVVSGELSVTIETATGEIEVGRCRPGEIIGELASIEMRVRTATVTAVGDTTVAEVEADRFQDCLADHPEAVPALVAAARQRIDVLSLAEIAADQYGTAAPGIVPRLLELAELIHLDAGATLFDEGAPADAVYVVVAGRLVVSSDRSPTGAARREIGRGETVGELAVLDSGVRTATVRAGRDTTLARIELGSFRSLVVGHPELALEMARTVVRRANGSPSDAVHRARSVAVVVTAPVDPESLVGPMRAESSRHGHSIWLSSEVIDGALDTPGSAQARGDSLAAARLAQFLHQRDSTGDHIVYWADREPTSWSEHAVRMADCVVFISSAEPGPDERDLINRFLAAGSKGNDRPWLAVLEEANAATPGCTAKLPLRDRFSEVHHLRRGDAMDLARLTRLGIGVGTGLVLGGGGARGFAHLGVIRAMRERGMEIDRIGGTSMGSIMGALAALHADDDELLATARRQFQQLFDYTVPLVSLVKAKRITRKLDAVFGGIDIEDLWIPLYCMSTNLTLGRPEVHRRGDLVSAIRASIAIPGVLPPVPRDGELLVDGGVLNNLPVDVMRADPSIGRVVAVDVTPPTGPRARGDYGMHVSGWRALAAVAGRKRSPYPTVGSVLMRSMIAGSEQTRSACLADGMIDLYLNIHITGVGLLEFDKLDQVVEDGYRSAAPQIEEWLHRSRQTSEAICHESRSSSQLKGNIDG